MKKSNIKLSLNKKNVSNLQSNTIIGGVSGRTCEYTNKYYKSCYSACPTPPVTNNCGNTIFVCDH